MSKKLHRTSAIKITNCEDILLQDNKAYGTDHLADISDSRRVDAIGNLHISGEAMQIFNRVELEIKSGVQKEDPKKIAEINDSFQQMKLSYGLEGFLSKYAAFISTLSDHVTVLAAVVPLLSKLITKS